MLNPDGVILGNSRVGLAGWDLNRKWANPIERLFPTIFHLKKLIASYQAQGRVAVYCDLHGRSLHPNIFTYGCYKHKSVTRNVKVAGSMPGTDPRVFPMIVAKDSPFFSYKSCDFRVHKSKLHTGRVVVHDELGVIHSYTLEASFCGPNYGSRKRTQFSALDLEAMGRDWCQGLLKYMRLLGQIQHSTELWREVQDVKEQDGIDRIIMDDSGAGLADLMDLLDCQDNDEDQEQFNLTDADALDLSDIEESTPEKEDHTFELEQVGPEAATHRHIKTTESRESNSKPQPKAKANRISSSSLRVPISKTERAKMERTATTKATKKTSLNKKPSMPGRLDSVTKIRRLQSSESTRKRSNANAGRISSTSRLMDEVIPTRLMPGIGRIELPEVTK